MNFSEVTKRGVIDRIYAQKMKWCALSVVILFCISCEKSAPQKGEAGNTEDQFLQGVKYFSEEGVPQSYSNAVKHFRESADRGNDMAQFNLGVCYRDGFGVTQDYTQATGWFRKSAEQGNELAQLNLGVSYAKGQGVTQDYSEAVQWYRRSAEKGDGLATQGFRNKIHAVISAILLRCATKGPVIIIGATAILIVGLITAMTKWSTWSF